jgi:hypothetical protein
MALQTTGPGSVFARYAGVVPENYLRVLAYKESGFRPDVVHPQSKATGLFQITNTALSSFNQRNASSLQLPQLVDPDINTQVASQHLAGVINVYKKYRALQPDWNSRRWLELLTLGWNAGHNAVAQIVGRMEASGLPVDRINVDTVSQAAAAIGGKAKYVGDSARVAWSKSVAAKFLGGTVPALVAKVAEHPGMSATGFFVFAGLGYLVFRLAKGRREALA